MNDGQVAALLEAMRREYVSKAREEAAGLIASLSDEEQLSSAEDLTKAKDSLHKLAGSGGSFGFPEFGAAAKNLEILIGEWLAKGSFGRHLVNSVELKTAIALLRDGMPGDSPSSLEGASAAISGDAARDTFRVGVISSDDRLLAELAQGLGAFGYEVFSANSPGELVGRSQKNPPSAVLIDAAEAEIVQEVLIELGSLPVLVIAERSDFTLRFTCAQAGAQGFMRKPADVPRLVDWLDRFRNHGEDAPFRILIIDDDKLLAERFRLVLSQSGMEAAALTDPAKTLEMVNSFRPDLILLDLYMPGYPGADLARAIRQDDDWLAVPIVYLSAERDMDAQLSAMTRGGDDFLTKPISDAHLVTAVRVRAARARALSDLMNRDSLTGLLKHARIKDQLLIECERARRSGEPLCAAMMDIDRFKSINDTYGHAVGDRVIKALAQLLKQRLRKTDLIGRYGGEEFAVVLTACDLEEAASRLDDIRLRFAAIEFSHESGLFTSTLSGGVAIMSESLSGHALLGAADAALYRSKQEGRNRISQSPS